MKKFTFTGQLVCSIQDYRYLSGDRIWINAVVESFATDTNDQPSFDHFTITLENPDRLDFSYVHQILISYSNGALTAWEVLV